MQRQHSHRSVSPDHLLLGSRLGAIVTALLIALALPAQAQRIDPALLGEFHWRLIGPANPAGRAWKVVGVPRRPKTFYVTTAGGGLWKSSNHGTTIEPVFNSYSSASTGAVAVAPSNPDIVWLGTGEPASTRANSWGDGVYRSGDGGHTWVHKGLDDTRQISAIVIDPRDPDTVWVAAMGHLWGANSERGVFKTSDGGQTWERVLYLNDTTGAIDLCADPRRPQVLYAALWQRFRYGGGDMDEAGPQSGIYKTSDGGETWVRLEHGLPKDDMGKIQLAVAYHDSNIVYAAILTGEPAGRGRRTSRQGGIFRSRDGGASWTRVNPMMTSYYYQHIYVDPSDDNTLWMPVFELWRSRDGGKTFQKQNLHHVHNDLHGMWIDPNDSEHILLAGDGGVNVSFDGARSWYQPPLPIGQFYQVAVDNQDPYFVYGGMQDTGHWAGPSRTRDAEGITNRDWFKLRITGDGMAIQIDPRDPNILYMVQEFGNFSRLDLRSWDRWELKPAAQEVKRRGLSPLRYDWTPPMILSRHDPDVLYLGSQYLLRYRDGGKEWEAVSPDLTRQQESHPRGIRDGYHSYGALFSIAESPLGPELLWVGADDGPIHLTRDGGRHWVDVTDRFPREAPTRAVVAEIEASRFGAGRAYVAYDAHKLDDVHPYLFRTDDFGESWSNISGDLPPRGSSYVIREDPLNPDLLFCGTEFGVFFTIDSGVHWTPLQNNLPTAGVRAMVIQEREKELVVGTFGRDIWILDIAPLEELSSATLAKPVHLFGVPPATLYKRRYTYGATIEQLNGDMFFRAQNPPYGTVITYYLAHDAGSPARITISDKEGRIVRRLEGPARAGIHRLVWDLQSDLAAPPPAGLTPSEREARGRVAPGPYTVRLEAAGQIEQVPVSVHHPPRAPQQARPRQD